MWLRIRTELCFCYTDVVVAFRLTASTAPIDLTVAAAPSPAATHHHDRLQSMRIHPAACFGQTGIVQRPNKPVDLLSVQAGGYLVKND